MRTLPVVLAGSSAQASPNFEDFQRTHRDVVVLDEQLRTLAAELAAERDDGVLDATFRHNLMRASAWVHTLAKLDEVFDVQAHVSGCRALFELLVDLDLLTAAPKRVRELRAYEQLELVRATRDLVASADTLPEVREAAHAYLREKAPAIEREAKLAGVRSGGGHRWSGRTLEQDARTASPEAKQFLGALHRMLNWGTHGSVNPFFRQATTDAMPGHSAMALEFSVRAALAVAQRVTQQLGRVEVFDHGMLRIESLRRHFESIAAM